MIILNTDYPTNERSIQLINYEKNLHISFYINFNQPFFL